MSRWIFLLSLFMICFHLPYSSAQKQCANDGEYCQNHSDCCSRSCMSFSYRCVPSLQPIFKPAVILSPASGSSLDNRGSFGSNSGRPCAATGGYCQNHWDCCSNSCLSFSHLCVDSNQPPQNGRPVLLNRGEFYSVLTKNDEEPKRTLEDLVNSVFSETGGNSVPSPPIDTEQNCKQIGEKCYRNEECCSQRCHGYLHQCVT